MRRTLLCLAAVSLVSCSDQAQLSRQPPAAQLSLVELAGGNVETTFVGVAPAELPPSTSFRSIKEALEAGEMDVMEADRLVMALLFGGRNELPDEWQESTAESGIPDLALFWIMQRLPSYPAEIQDEIVSWFPGVRANRVGKNFPGLNLWPVSVAHASSGASLALESGQCVPSLAIGPRANSMWQGPFEKLGEASVTLGGAVRSVVVCGRSAADLGVATRVLSAVTQALPAMDAFFESKLSGRFDRPGPAIQFFIEETINIDQSGTTTGAMVACNRIAVSRDLEQCELKGVVIHETFHCLDMEAQGYSGRQIPSAFFDQMGPGGFYGRRAEWVTEGVAKWSEDRFAVDNNSEWPVYTVMAEYPQLALEDREHDAAIFFTFLGQHAGGDNAIRDVLDNLTNQTTGRSTDTSGVSESVLEELFLWPKTWFDFADALSGFKPLYEVGRPELTDQPVFPYEESAGCGGEVYLSQDYFARYTPLEPNQALAYNLVIPGLSVSYETVDMRGPSGIQYVDVGFAGDVIDRMLSGKLQVTAVLRTTSEDRVVNWTDLWVTEGQWAEPIRVPPGIALQTEDPFAESLSESIDTEGRFRVCLTDEVLGCFDRPEAEIYRDLYEINIIMANAGMDDEDDIPSVDASYLVLLPGAMPGWKAIRVEDRPSFEE